MIKIPLRVQPSRIAHHLINRIAHKFAPLAKSHGSDAHWLWKLNNWVARPWVDWYVYKRIGKTRNEWEDK